MKNNNEPEKDNIMYISFFLDLDKELLVNITACQQSPKHGGVAHSLMECSKYN